VLNGVCGKLVYCHGQRLGLFWRDRDLGAALREIFTFDSTVHRKLLQENLPDINCACRCPAQQCMGARNGSQSVVKSFCELVKAMAFDACPPRDRANGRQHVVDAMLKLVTKHFLAERPLGQLSLDPHSIDSGRQQIGVVLKKIDVVLLEFPELPRVNLQNTKWAVLAANDNIDGAPDAMLDQEFGNCESNLALGIFGDHRLVRVQGIASRRALMCRYCGMPYYAGAPIHPGSDKQILAAWE
jgi:hypothetical protein